MLLLSRKWVGGMKEMKINSHQDNTISITCLSKSRSEPLNDVKMQKDAKNLFNFLFINLPSGVFKELSRLISKYEQDGRVL